MKILLLCESYPSVQNIYAMSFIHARVVEYKKCGHEVVIASFSTRSNYQFEGVHVVTIRGVEQYGQFDIIISHAPNFRNHLRFLYFYKYKSPLIFFIHGHEVLMVNDYYPRPFPHERAGWDPVKRFGQNMYDLFKLKLFPAFLKWWQSSGHLVRIIFVSEWMKQETLKCISLDSSWVQMNTEVISNPTAAVFTINHYQSNNLSKGRFICIRPFDGPKYAIDIATNWAKAHPSGQFDFYGQGSYFDYNTVPKNVRIFKQFVQQVDIPNLLNNYNCALMPTRLDAQGVMMCEMAVYGIPLITSDLAVTEEMLGDFPNVLRCADEMGFQLEDIPIPLSADSEFRSRFVAEKTAHRELEFFQNAISRSKMVPEK